MPNLPTWTLTRLAGTKQANLRHAKLSLLRVLVCAVCRFMMRFLSGIEHNCSTLIPIGYSDKNFSGGQWFFRNNFKIILMKVWVFFKLAICHLNSNILVLEIGGVGVTTDIVPKTVLFAVNTVYANTHFIPPALALLTLSSLKTTLGGIS